jgi:hypothetical protein
MKSMILAGVFCFALAIVDGFFFHPNRSSVLFSSNYIAAVILGAMGFLCFSEAVRTFRRLRTIEKRIRQ